jgi:hypothetical protein
MCVYSCDTSALAGNQFEPAKKPAGKDWINAWLYLDSDFQPSRSESSIHDKSTCDMLKLFN